MKLEDEHKVYVRCTCGTPRILTNKETACKSCGARFSATFHGMSKPYEQAFGWPTRITLRKANTYGHQKTLSGLRFNISDQVKALIKEINGIPSARCSTLTDKCSDGRTRVSSIHAELMDFDRNITLNMTLYIYSDKKLQNSYLLKQLLINFKNDCTRVKSGKDPEHWHDMYKRPVEWVKEYSY